MSETISMPAPTTPVVDHEINEAFKLTPFFSYRHMRNHAQWGAMDGIGLLSKLTVVVGGAAAAVVVTYGVAKGSEFLSTKSLQMARSMRRKAISWKDSIKEPQQAVAPALPPAEPTGAA